MSSQDQFTPFYQIVSRIQDVGSTFTATFPISKRHAIKMHCLKDVWAFPFFQDIRTMPNQEEHDFAELL
jgi:hypothetical protein